MRLAPVANKTFLPGLIETGRCCDIVERLLPVDRQRAFQRSTVDSVGDLEAKPFASVITPDFLLSLNYELVCELAQAVERYHEALTEVAPATVAELVTEIDPVVTAHYLQHFRELLSHPPRSCSGLPLCSSTMIESNQLDLLAPKWLRIDIYIYIYI